MKHKGFMAIAIAVGALGSASMSYAQMGAASPRPAAAGVQVDKSRPNTYGITDETSYGINAFDFVPFNTATTETNANGFGSRWFTTATSFLEAPVNIPNGALITGIEIQGCDTSTSGSIIATLYSNTSPRGAFTLAEFFISHGGVFTGAFFNLGCGFFFAPLPNIEVDNFNRSYFVQVQTGTTDNTNRFAAVRLYYLLQVSPAPATATFADVPVGSPFHRFVEALVAAGITGGCGGGNYCPNLPVTRGQMAVFLAAALGLHFPN